MKSVAAGNSKLGSKLKVPPAIRGAFSLAKKARRGAYAPYSRFLVGSVLLSKGGVTFEGCNVENASYGGTICAERVAILGAVASGVRKFTDIVVVTDAPKPAFPCALCLQTMAEFFDPTTRIWIADLKAVRSMHTFKELLPNPFGPRELAGANL